MYFMIKVQFRWWSQFSIQPFVVGMFLEQYIVSVFILFLYPNSFLTYSVALCNLHFNSLHEQLTNGYTNVVVVYLCFLQIQCIWSLQWRSKHSFWNVQWGMSCFKYWTTLALLTQTSGNQVQKFWNCNHISVICSTVWHVGS